MIIEKKDNPEEACEVFCREGVGASILFKNVTLITRHSTDIVFYKRERIDDYGISHSIGSKLEKYKWKEIHVLPLEGQISHNKNQDFFIITTLDKIFQYTIDKETLEPIQIGLMYNNMDCRRVISSPKDQAYISYNMNQSDFRIYNRRFQHCFKAELNNFHDDFNDHKNNYDHQNISKFLAVNLECAKGFAVADEKTIRFYDAENFTQYPHRIDLDLTKFDKQNKGSNSYLKT